MRRFRWILLFFTALFALAILAPAFAADTSPAKRIPAGAGSARSADGRGRAIVRRRGLRHQRTSAHPAFPSFTSRGKRIVGGVARPRSAPELAAIHHVVRLSEAKTALGQKVKVCTEDGVKVDGVATRPSRARPSFHP